MRRVFATATATVWAAAWFACSSFEEGSTAAEPDAATSDGPTTDATTEASTGDDACTAWFCDGFERDADLGNGWSELTLPKFAQLSLSLHPRSGTGSMQLVLHGDAGPEAGRTAQLVKYLPIGATRVMVDFWLFYTEAPSTVTTLANVTLTDDGNVLFLHRPAGGFVLAEQYRVDGGPLIYRDVNVGELGNNKPRHIVLEVGTTLLDSGRTRARLTVDDDSSDLELLTPTVDARPARVWIGAGYSEPGARNEDTFWYDDVIIDATPL